MIKKLSREEFKEALIKGHGRAVMHVKQYGLDGIDDIMLNACLHDVSYDPTCTKSRSRWLIDMFWNTPVRDELIRKIIHAFNQRQLINHSDHIREIADTRQLCEFVCDMALKGCDISAQALREKMYMQKSLAYLMHPYYAEFMQALIKVDGIKAYVWFAQQLGNALIQHENDDETREIIWLYAEDIVYRSNHEVQHAAQLELDEQKTNNTAILAFVTYKQKEAQNFESKRLELLAEHYPLTKEQKQVKRECVLKEIDLQQILEDKFQTPKFKPNYYKHRQFGLYATQEELESIFQKLINERNEQTCIRLLWVFCKAVLPEPHPHIFEMATSSNAYLKEATLKALAQVDNALVGDFARHLIQSEQCPRTVALLIDLFSLNYIHGDELLILNAMVMTESDESLHRYSTSICRVLKNNTNPALLMFALWIYEKNPCEECRTAAVKWMCRQSLLPDTIREECLSDASSDIWYLVSDFLDLAKCENEKKKPLHYCS